MPEGLNEFGNGRRKLGCYSTGCLWLATCISSVPIRVVAFGVVTAERCWCGEIRIKFVLQRGVRPFHTDWTNYFTHGRRLERCLPHGHTEP